MNRKLGILSFAIFLLLAQGLSLAHIAKYGVDPHQHHGKSCEVFLSADKAQIASSDDSAKIILPELFVLQIISPEKILVKSSATLPFQSRAPPFFS